MQLKKLNPIYIYHHRAAFFPILRRIGRALKRPVDAFFKYCGEQSMMRRHPLIKIQVQTCSWCNLRCGFCPNITEHANRTQELMDRSVYDKIIADLKQIDFSGMFIPYLMNESMLDPRLVELVSYARRELPKAYILIDTNCTLLTKEKLKTLIDAGVDDIRLNCYSEDMYERMMALVATLDNREPVRYIVPYYKERERSAYYNRGGNIDVHNRVDQIPDLKMRCLKPFNQMFVNFRGDALVCCSDWQYRIVMGNVQKESLMNIWNNARYALYRNLLCKGERRQLDLCNKCNYIENGLTPDLMPQTWKRSAPDRS